MTDPVVVPKLTPYESVPNATISAGNRNVVQFKYNFPEPNPEGLTILSVVLADTVSGGKLVALNFVSGMALGSEQISYVSDVQLTSMGDGKYSFSPRTFQGIIDQQLIATPGEHTMWVDFDFPNSFSFGIDNKIGTSNQSVELPELSSSYYVYIQAGYLSQKQWGLIVNYMRDFAYWKNDNPAFLFMYFYGGARFKYNKTHHGHHDYIDFGNTHHLGFNYPMTNAVTITDVLIANTQQMTCLGQTTANPDVQQCQTTWKNWCRDYPDDPRCECLLAPQNPKYQAEIEVVSPVVPYQCWLPPCVKAGNFTDVTRTNCPSQVSVCEQIIDAGNSNQRISQTTQYQVCCSQIGTCQAPTPTPPSSRVFLILGIFLIVIVVIFAVLRARKK